MNKKVMVYEKSKMTMRAMNFRVRYRDFRNNLTSIFFFFHGVEWFA